MTAQLRLCGIAVNWHDEERLQRLVEAWPEDDSCELIILDNGSTEPLPEGVEVLALGRNFGFAGAVNLGLQQTRATLVLVMNSDVCPRPDAIESLIHGFDLWPDAVALAPRMVGHDGSSQAGWQLRPLPSLTTLLLQALLLPATGEVSSEPGTGALLEQPAAAALAFRRDALLELGGFDEAFFPAWFEDVDLAKRMTDAGMPIRYCPEAEFQHQLGSSIPRLGYGGFLRIYYSNLCRYLRKHHGRFWAGLARVLLIPASLLRLALVPLRRPRRASTRREAARGLWWLALGAMTGWSYPDATVYPGGAQPTPDGPHR